jgi:hydroxyethylthiazole kinase-like uncharacterized protein yjeF
VVVLTGAGNNGGDGWVAARLLHAAAWPVRVWEVLPARADDARVARREALEAGVQALDAAPWDPHDVPVQTIEQHGLVLIDALLGLGGRDGLPEPIASAIVWMGRTAEAGNHCCVVAVDLPSGLDADTGRALLDAGGRPCSVQAHQTVSLLTLKPGLFTHEGRDRAGRVWWDDLQSMGSPIEVCAQTNDTLAATQVASQVPTRALSRPAESHAGLSIEPVAGLVEGSVLQELTRARVQRSGAPRAGGHKGRHGDAWLLGGAAGMGGAPVLAARAALAAGAGRVHRVDLDDARASATDSMAPEVMTPGSAAFNSALERHGVSPNGSLVVVAGCGGGAAIAQRLPDVLHRSSCLVLDADALNAVAADPSLMIRLKARSGRGLRTVLTPHPLEAARLLGCNTAQVQANRLQAASTLAERSACTVVLKGAGSVIATPGLLPWINASGNARLASGGTGDVLAGWIGGAWACRGDALPCTPDELHRLTAACVHLHGRAADAVTGDGHPATAVLQASDLVLEMARELMRATHRHQR